MEPVVVGEVASERSPWAEIPPRGRRERQHGAVAEIVRWARFVDPGSDASEFQRAAAIEAVVDLVDDPELLHDAWATSLRMLARGEVTRSLVALLAEAIRADEVNLSA
jgi:hypothetical protein